MALLDANEKFLHETEEEAKKYGAKVSVHSMSVADRTALRGSARYEFKQEHSAPDQRQRDDQAGTGDPFRNPTMGVGKQITGMLVLHKKISKSEAEKKAVEIMKNVGVPDAEDRFSLYPSAGCPFAPRCRYCMEIRNGLPPETNEFEEGAAPPSGCPLRNKAGYAATDPDPKIYEPHRQKREDGTPPAATVPFQADFQTVLVEKYLDV